MEISQRTIRTSEGIVYEIARCQEMLNKFDSKSKEYALAFKIWVSLARRASLYAYEGEIVKV